METNLYIYIVNEKTRILHKLLTNRLKNLKIVKIII